ncbi:hypothetical protein [Bradyrhizobium sp.]|uniref:hypothetical protein n=1 Tax=Bradyrhizobium sp. TaxID=376 RepID=UPI001ECA0FEF|nr:hypothetical protein [Bradyrhizobium sp.]MBV8919781.1 hypothetical protein [Bradyrhizobium sp.]MBV9983114.1 hypothetical protein [Bradyrhizobium sp.]
MLRTIAAGCCISLQALILSSSPVTSMTISRCTQSTDGTRVCTTCPANARSDDAATAPSGTLASLLAEGYEIIQVGARGMLLGGGTIILRKELSYTPTFLCNLEPIDSPADKAFKSCRYDQVPCSRAPDKYP